MKRLIRGIVPILLLVLALTFMTKYKQVNDLTDSEKYEVRTYVEAAESTDREQEILDSDANNENEEHDVDPNMTYAITSDEETVTIHDYWKSRFSNNNGGLGRKP